MTLLNKSRNDVRLCTYGLSLRQDQDFTPPRGIVSCHQSSGTKVLK